MVTLYLILGLSAAILGALPLGAVNIAVINTAIKENIQKSLYIAVAAGVAEVFLALFALHCSMEISGFFEQNRWIQITFIISFLFIGVYFLIFKNKAEKPKKQPKPNFGKSKFLTGFSLAFLNPPVIIYWIIAISLTNKHLFNLNAQTSLLALSLFFFGIYLGKISTLYLYSRWGNKMAQKKGDSKEKLSRIIGTALIVLSFFQGIKFLVE